MCKACSPGAVEARGAVPARNERAHVLFTDNLESRPVLCYLITFLALADVSSVKISSRLFGGARRSHLAL